MDLALCTAALSNRFGPFFVPVKQTVMRLHTKRYNFMLLTLGYKFEEEPHISVIARSHKYMAIQYSVFIVSELQTKPINSSDL